MQNFVEKYFVKLSFRIARRICQKSIMAYVTGKWIVRMRRRKESAQIHFGIVNADTLVSATRMFNLST
jgi:hypothetical protein